MRDSFWDGPRPTSGRWDGPQGPVEDSEALAGARALGVAVMAALMPCEALRAYAERTSWKRGAMAFRFQLAEKGDFSRLRAEELELVFEAGLASKTELQKARLFLQEAVLTLRSARQSWDDVTGEEVVPDEAIILRDAIALVEGHGNGCSAEEKENWQVLLDLLADPDELRAALAEME